MSYYNLKKALQKGKEVKIIKQPSGTARRYVLKEYMKKMLLKG